MRFDKPKKELKQLDLLLKEERRLGKSRCAGEFFDALSPWAPGPEMTSQEIASQVASNKVMIVRDLPQGNDNAASITPKIA